MIIIDITLLVIIVVGIFIFNATVMRRNLVDQSLNNIKYLLKQRLDNATKILSEPITTPSKDIVELLKLDAEIEQKIQALPGKSSQAELAKYLQLAIPLHAELEKYEQQCEAYNKIIVAPPFRWLPKFSPRPQIFVNLPSSNSDSL